MASDWPTGLLADLCDSVDYGFTASATTEPVGPKFLRITDIRQQGLDWGSVPHVEIDDSKLDRYRLHHGDIVVARTGAFTGANAYLAAPVGAVFASYLVRLKSGPRLHSRYAYYFMQSNWYADHVAGVIGGSAQPNASAKALTRVLMPVPPLDEQRRIAAILGALDDKIEFNRKMNRTLEEMAQAIFKSWFIDFDGHCSAPADMVDSELGPIPRGWVIKPLPEIIDINPRTTLKVGITATFVEMADLPTSGCSVTSSIKKDVAGGGAKFRLGDTLLARITPCLENGKTALVDFLDEGEVGFGSTEFIVLRPKADFHAAWTYCLARSLEFRQHAISNMTGSSGRQRVPTDCFTNFAMPEPDVDTLRRFGAVAGPAFDRIKANADQSRTLAALRDALLPKLISGEIRVPEAEAAVEEAA